MYNHLDVQSCDGTEQNLIKLKELVSELAEVTD